MELEHDECYRAIQARDARFDGQFFTAVRTTGIYCRPICPAPTPKTQNCTFFSHAAAAQKAGFRPCLRCRPELAPALSAAMSTSGTVDRALEYIATGALDDGSLGQLAERVGVTERHLRRLFVTHLGASPLTFALTRRILFSKQLITETNLSLTEVALAAGFNSLRRFNATIYQTYGRTPRELRKGREDAPPRPTHSAIRLKLAFSPPYNWTALVSFLEARAIPGVELVSPTSYRRTFCLDGQAGMVEVEPLTGQNYLVATIHFPKVAALGRIVERLRHIFDLGANVGQIAADLERDPYLGRAVAALPGLRVPGAWDSFELAVRAMLGQQISVKAATTLAGRLVEAYGEPLGDENLPITPGLNRLFPTPAVLAEADLTRIGLTRARAAALNALAAAVVRDEQAWHGGGGQLETAVKQLCKLPGVGEWTAHYIAMRALREPDAFPATDLGLLRAMATLEQPMSPGRLSQIAEAWRPWRAYAAMYLWLSEPAVLTGVRDQGSGIRDQLLVASCYRSSGNKSESRGVGWLNPKVYPHRVQPAHTPTGFSGLFSDDH